MLEWVLQGAISLSGKAHQVENPGRRGKGSSKLAAGRTHVKEADVGAVDIGADRDMTSGCTKIDERRKLAKNLLLTLTFKQSSK
jgi:hypothetical protein